jgi:uncharacterized protein YggE
MSYYSDDNISITVNGSAETVFTSATFKASVTTLGKTGPEARGQAAPIIESIKRVLISWEDKGGIDLQRLRTTFDVSTNTSRSGDFNGYKAIYTIQFTAWAVAAAPAIHGALTSIETVEAETPVYHVKDSTEVQARAFADAVEKAKLKFAAQCVALDKDPQGYYVRSWITQDQEHHGKTLSFSDGQNGDFRGHEPGWASLDIRATFLYKEREPR